MQRWSRVAVVAVATLVVGFALYTLGARKPQVIVVTAKAYVGQGQATAFASDGAIGIPMDGRWEGLDGVWHDSGQPTCLTAVGSTVPITFGVVPVTAPGGRFWRQVVWVSCSG